MLGVNNEAHFRVKEEAKWHNFGNTVAPKEMWSTLLDRPGMQSLTIRQRPRPDKHPGHIEITVEPSARVVPFGLYVRINEQLEFTTIPPESRASPMLEFLTQHWTECQTFADRVFSHLTAGL
jgi:hypothetical protein